MKINPLSNINDFNFNSAHLTNEVNLKNSTPSDIDNFNFNSTHLTNEVNFKKILYDKTIPLAPLINEPSSKYSYVIGSNPTDLIVSQHKNECRHMYY